MSEPKSPEERRQSPRFSKTMSVQVKSDVWDVTGHISDDAAGKNIGLGGLSFVSGICYEMGGNLDMLVRIADWDPDALKRGIYIAVSSAPYRVAGRVVRCEEMRGHPGHYEVGVRFTEIAEDDRKLLARHLGLD
ncbi:MAG: PilZ domain-containing protein [Deltaproteobacteria bacterium]|nr:PilZ domain-containing protein [Deltaproteobacteria bacterium]